MKVTITLVVDSTGGHSEADFVNDEAWKGLINQHTDWEVADVTSSVKALTVGRME